VIARVWRGWVAPEQAHAYAAYMKEVAIPAYARARGNRGAWMLHRPDGDREEFAALSMWESLEAIMTFAGADVERAVFYPRDDEFLLEREWTVRHYEVSASAPRN
jgi:heme-degrading monooxygenase HmoA